MEMPNANAVPVSNSEKKHGQPYRQTENQLTDRETDIPEAMISS